MGKQATRLANFKRALQRLQEAVSELNASGSDVVRDGVIQRFEFTYELAWKAARGYLEELGIADKNSPKAVFKEAYDQKLITNEQNWLLMINDRNLTSHVYNAEMAKEITGRIVNCYIDAFTELWRGMQK